MNVSQESMSHMNDLSGSRKNTQQHHGEAASNLRKDTTRLGLFADIGHFSVIVAKDHFIRLCPQNASTPIDLSQQKYVPQKAIAVVTPLKQQVVESVALLKNLNKNETTLDTRCVPKKTVDGPHILHTLQPTKESGAETNDSTSQIKELLSKPTEMPRCVKDGEKSERLSSFSLNVRVEREEGEQISTGAGDNCSTEFLRENDDQISAGMETRMDNLPVTEWTLPRLHTLVSELEQKRKRQQKDDTTTDLFSEILKLFWNGDYRTFYYAATSKMYRDTMKEVQSHCGTANSVILQAVSRESLNQLESRFHVLEHGIAPPKVVYTSSWLNPIENLVDIDQEHGCPSSVVTLHQRPNPPDKELPKKPEPTHEIVKVSYKAQTDGEEQSTPLPTEHQMNLSDTIGGTAVMEVKTACSSKTTEVPSEKTNALKGQNDAPSIPALSTQSSDASDGCIKAGNSSPPLSTDMTPVLEENDIADCVSSRVSMLPHMKPERLLIGETEEEAFNMEKDEGQISTDSKGQTSAVLFGKHVDAEMKSYKKSNKININCQVDTTCCLAKWFQMLGYNNGDVCKCEMKADAVTSGTDVTGENVPKHSRPCAEACQFTDVEQRNNRRTKNRCGYRRLTGRKSVPSPTDDDDDDDASMDELEIVEVITNYDDVLKLANSMSEQLIEKRLQPGTSHESASGKKRCRRRHNQNPVPEINTADTQINLALFGTSQMKQEKHLSLFTPHTIPIPPKTVNVTISSVANKRPNSTKSQTLKQEVWNSWRKTYVPLKSSTRRKAKKPKRPKVPETQHTADNAVIKTRMIDPITTLLSPAQNRPGANDERTLSLASAEEKKKGASHQSHEKSRKQIGSTRNEKKRKSKRNQLFSSFNLKRRWNSAKSSSKLIKTCCDAAQPDLASENKPNAGVALNFGVLPESFNISDGSSSVEANQSASVDGGGQDRTVMLIKRKWGISGAWCVSPRKKQCLKSSPSLPNTSGRSIFQEFKKKYEEKKQQVSA